MTLNRRLILAFGASVLVTVLLGVVSLQQGLKMSGMITELTSSYIANAFSIGRINGLAKDLRGKMRSHVVEQDPKAKAKIDQEIGDLESRIAGESQRLEANLMPGPQQRLFGLLEPRFRDFRAAWQNVGKSSLAQDPRAMDHFLAEVMPKFKPLQEGLDGLEAQLKRDAEEAQAESNSAARITQGLAIALLVLSVLVNAGMGYWTIWFANRSLMGSVDQLRESAGLITGMAQELNEANQQISSGATEQVAAIQGTTQAGDRVRGMAQKFAVQAGTVTETVGELNRGMEEAKRTLQTMVSHMKAIEETSNKIQRLSGLVDAIAFQTHILSLNASIEAARSGEAGRGFEVVAGEVKSLARQSGEAAQETAKLISESLQAVGDGSKSLTQIVATVQHVGRATEQIRGLVGEIESASREQASNLVEISSSLREVEVVSSRTAAAAEQGFAQQQEMEAQAAALLHVVDDLQRLVKHSN